jgi:hypothetical protein
LNSSNKIPSFFSFDMLCLASLLVSSWHVMPLVGDLSCQLTAPYSPQETAMFFLPPSCTIPKPKPLLAQFFARLGTRWSELVKASISEHFNSGVFLPPNFLLSALFCVLGDYYLASSVPSPVLVHANANEASFLRRENDSSVIWSSSCG